MKVKNMFRLMLIFLVFSGAAYMQGQVAPWAPLSNNAPDKLPGRYKPIPPSQDVGIPVFPGAYLTSISAPVKDTVLLKNSKILPFINLVTSASQSEVISFYKSHLSKSDGWQWSEEYKTFVRGKPVSALTGEVPTVAIREENGENFDLTYVKESFKKKLKTRIQITYKALKKKTGR